LTNVPNGQVCFRAGGTQNSCLLYHRRPKVGDFCVDLPEFGHQGCPYRIRFCDSSFSSSSIATHYKSAAAIPLFLRRREFRPRLGVMDPHAFNFLSKMDRSPGVDGNVAPDDTFAAFEDAKQATAICELLFELLELLSHASQIGFQRISLTRVFVGRLLPGTQRLLGGI
jgi:hypothetical protein